jgi:hypothetical protein
MKFNFNKKMVSTIVILIFGVAITVAALSAKNIALENKTSSEIAKKDQKREAQRDFKIRNLG